MLRLISANDGIVAAAVTDWFFQCMAYYWVLRAWFGSILFSFATSHRGYEHRCHTTAEAAKGLWCPRQTRCRQSTAADAGRVVPVVIYSYVVTSAEYCDLRAHVWFRIVRDASIPP